MSLRSLTVAITASAAGIDALAHMPPKREGITVVESETPGVSLSFRETTVCETTEGVRGYSGYVHLPPDAPYQDYQANFYFWFFEARNNPKDAPLIVYFEGGPGGPGVPSAMSGAGPCYVNDDGNSTRINPFSWNNDANIIFIDQPITTGFSYGDNHEVMPALKSANVGSLLGVVAAFEQTIEFGNESLLELCEPAQMYTFEGNTSVYQCGAFAPNTISNAPRSNRMAGVAMWNFFQAWFDLAPFYRSESPSLHFWGTSYGGMWGPGFASYFLDRNDAILAGEENGTVIEVAGVGIINGIIDGPKQERTRIDFLYNNTFGASYYGEEFYMEQLARSDECLPIQKECTRLADELDPERYGLVDEVFEICKNATACSRSTSRAFVAEYLLRKNLSAGDIIDQRAENWFNFSSNLSDTEPSFPSLFLNQDWVQLDIGVEMNFTMDLNLHALPVRQSLEADIGLTNGTRSLIKLLDRGVRVTLAAGDYDQMLGWPAQEIVALDTQYNSSSGASFSDATWNELMAEENTKPAGLVRESGLLSVTRVFDAAHGAFIDQPGTIYSIVSRAIGRTIIVDGSEELRKDYITTGGLKDAFDWQYPRRGLGRHYCNLGSIFKCSPEEFTDIAEGRAIIEDYWYMGTAEEEE